MISLDRFVASGVLAEDRNGCGGGGSFSGGSVQFFKCLLAVLLLGLFLCGILFRLRHTSFDGLFFDLALILFLSFFLVVLLVLCSLYQLLWFVLQEG